MTNRPAQRWRVAETQQGPAPSPPLTHNTMSDPAAVAATAATEPHTTATPQPAVPKPSTTTPLSPMLPSLPSSIAPLPALSPTTSARRLPSHSAAPAV